MKCKISRCERCGDRRNPKWPIAIDGAGKGNLSLQVCTTCKNEFTKMALDFYKE